MSSSGKDEGATTGAAIEVFENPQVAVKEADVVYTDVWISMGREREQARRLKTLAPYQLNGRLLQRAKRDAIVILSSRASRGGDHRRGVGWPAFSRHRSSGKPITHAKGHLGSAADATERRAITAFMKQKPMKKIVLAISGGLDTSVILKWLQETYQAEIIAFCADLGQGEDLQAIKAKAQSLGVKKVYVEDLREMFVHDYVFPMLRGNAMYEGCYLLGTSIARPLIARRQAEIALKEGAEAVSHGATGRATIRCGSKSPIRRSRRL